MEFYSYLYLRIDGSPYYVGKGYGGRAYNRGSHRIKPPKDKSRIIIFPQENEAAAFESERALIWLFGRKDLGTGVLRNMTDGGEGSSNPSDEARQKLKEASTRFNARRRKLWCGVYGHNSKPKDRVPRYRISEIAAKQRQVWEMRFIKSVAWG